MKILVTGVNGFIGSHLAHKLAEKAEVIGLTRADSGTPKGIQIIICDLNNKSFPEGLPSKVDVIVHLAQAPANFPNSANEMLFVNTVSTQLLADYARKANVKRFVFASTGNVYKPSEDPLLESSPISPNSFYGLSKVTAENLLGFYQEYFEVSILRIFTPYGPGQRNRMIPKIIDLVGTGKPIVLQNNGQPKVTPIFIDDLIQLVDESIEMSGNQIINLAGPKIISVKDIAIIAGKILGKSPQFVYQTSAESWNLIGETSSMNKHFHMGQMIFPENGIEWTIKSRLIA